MSEPGPDLSTLYDAQIFLGSGDMNIDAAQTGHPNKVPFKGLLVRVDSPSDKAPNGSNGHRVMIPKEVAERALGSLIGMAVNISYNFEGHNTRLKIGVITGAEVRDGGVYVEGHLYGHDFKSEVEALQARSRAGELGMSFEITKIAIDDPGAEVWVIRDLQFTGAAILTKEAAAYHTTKLAASTSTRKSDNEKETCVKQKIEELTKSLMELTASSAPEREGPLASQAASQASGDGSELDQLKTEVQALRTTVEQMTQAAASTPEAAADQTAGIGFKSMMDELGEFMEFKQAMRSGRRPGRDQKANILKMLEELFEGTEGQSASQDQGDKREAKDLEAMVQMLTDQVSALTNQLTTDRPSDGGGNALATDAVQANQKEVQEKIDAANQATTPARKTEMPMFASKWGMDAEKEGGYTVDEVNKFLDDAGIKDPTDRMAKKLNLQAAGMVAG